MLKIDFTSLQVSLMCCNTCFINHWDKFQTEDSVHLYFEEDSCETEKIEIEYSHKQIVVYANKCNTVVNTMHHKHALLIKLWRTKIL